MIHPTKFALTCFALGVISSVATAAEKKSKVLEKPDAVVAYKSVENTDGSADELDLNVFNPEGHQASDKIPCIVFFFGGG